MIPQSAQQVGQKNPTALVVGVCQDCDGVLTGQILEIGDTYAMLYAGKKGKEWQTGLATIQRD